MRRSRPLIWLQIDAILRSCNDNDSNNSLLMIIHSTNISMMLGIAIIEQLIYTRSGRSSRDDEYTRSPLQDSRLFGPSPWKILAATNEKTYLSNPAPGENLVSGNLVMETGCMLEGGHGVSQLHYY